MTAAVFRLMARQMMASPIMEDVVVTINERPIRTRAHIISRDIIDDQGGAYSTRRVVPVAILNAEDCAGVRTDDTLLVIDGGKSYRIYDVKSNGGGHVEAMLRLGATDNVNPGRNYDF